MATQDDITVVNGDEEMGFHCGACTTRFEAMPTSAAHRARANGTLDQKVRMIVAEHIRECPGLPPETGSGGKKAGKSHKA